MAHFRPLLIHGLRTASFESDGEEVGSLPTVLLLAAITYDLLHDDIGQRTASGRAAGAPDLMAGPGSRDRLLGSVDPRTGRYFTIRSFFTLETPLTPEASFPARRALSAVSTKPLSWTMSL